MTTATATRPAAALGVRRAVLYGRQSHGKDKSIGEQLDLGAARAACEGWAVARRYQDKVSASRHAGAIRPEWLLLIDDVVQGRVDLIWLWETARGDRRAASWLLLLEACQEHNVTLYIETDRREYDLNRRRDWMTMAEDGLEAQGESDKIRDRVRRAKTAAREDGRLREILGGSPRVGYRNGKDDWETDPAHAAVLRSTAAGMRAGATLSDAFRAATEEHGAIWMNSAANEPVRPVTEKLIRAALRRPATAGLITEAGEGREGSSKVTGRAGIVDPPLDEETWNWLRREWFAKRAIGGRSVGSGAYPYALGPVLRCGKCGNPLSGSKQYHASPPVPVYACRNPHPKLGILRPCRGVSINAPELDELIGSLVDAYAEALADAGALADDGGAVDGRAAAVELDLAEVKGWLADLRRQRLHKIIEPWQYEEEAPEYEARIAELQGELAAVQAEQARPAPRPDKWADMTAEEQRAAVRETYGGPIRIMPGRGGARPLPVAERVILPEN